MSQGELAVAVIEGDDALPYHKYELGQDRDLEDDFGGDNYKVSPALKIST